MLVKEKLIRTIPINDLMVTGGIFRKIQSYDATLTEPLFPWLTSDLSLLIDKDYYLSHSGGKSISRLYARFIKMEDDGIIADALLEIAKLIHNRFALSWNKIYDAINTAYKPLENYDMKEKETPNVTKTRNIKEDMQTDNDVYGFNSTTPVPQSKSTLSGNKLNNEQTESETGTRDLERHGNIGVTTSQQMLQSEIDLRTNYNFMKQIMNDVDSMLCLLVY